MSTKENRKVFSAIKNNMSFVVQIMGIIMLLLNLWLASRLAPLAEDIRVLETRVAAVEKRVDKIDDNLIRMDNKLDTIIFKLNK